MNDKVSYVLRPAGPDDSAELLEIHRGAFRQLVETRFSWDPREQRRIVHESITGSQIIEIGGSAVGQLILETSEDCLFIKRIMLQPSWQGQGIGQSIVSEVMAQATRASLPVTLSVWENNAARRLYERLGFWVTHQEGFRVKMRWEPSGAS
jgi:GNAT superfamily N-acetyltransferase